MDGHEISLFPIQLVFDLVSAVADFADGVFHRAFGHVLFVCLVTNFMFLSAGDFGAILLATFS